MTGSRTFTAGSELHRPQSTRVVHSSALILPHSVRRWRVTSSTYPHEVSPRRPPRDVEGLNRVLKLLSLLMVVLTVGALAWGAWRVWNELSLTSGGEPAQQALLFLALAAAFAGVSVGCLRLSRDDGTGTWCEQCLTRNPLDTPVCHTCGATLPPSRR